VVTTAPPKRDPAGNHRDRYGVAPVASGATVSEAEVLTKRRDLSPVRIEVDRRSRPISGRLWTDHGDEVRFVGWLELIAAVERSCAAMPASPEPPGHTSISS